jgi:hypothetical protein
VSGSYTYAVHDAFGLRTIAVRNLQSPAEGVYSYAQDSARRVHVPGGGDYVAEAGGALVGGALVGAGSGYALGLAGWYLGGVAIGYPCGCALGTTTVSSWLNLDGNTGAAYGGAYAGMAAGMAMGVLVGLVSRRWDVGLLAVGVLPPAGAVVGYNRGLPGTDSRRPSGARLAPPTLAYRTRLGPDRQRYSAFDCRLVTVRF